MGRAGALIGVLVEYSWGASHVSSDLRDTLELLDDLQYVADDMLEYLDDEEGQP